MADIPHRPYIFEVELSAVGVTAKFDMPGNATSFAIAVKNGSDPVLWNTDPDNVEGDPITGATSELRTDGISAYELPNVPSNRVELPSALYFDLAGGGSAATITVAVS